MPRYFVRDPGERVRRDTGRVRFYKQKWVDPYYWIQGSSIEKMVMAELVRRGIYFQHTPQTNELPWYGWMLAEGTKKWEADFLFPQHKIWLEIQGTYFHSLRGQMETDALRFAYIEEVGWRPIAWWEDDIRVRLPELMNEVPEFYMVDHQAEQQAMQRYGVSEGLPFYEGGDGVDHLAGLRTALRNRARPPQNMRMRYATKRRPK